MNVAGWIAWRRCLLGPGRAGSGSVLILAVGMVGAGPSLQTPLVAQERTDLSGFETCEECSIELTRLVTLGPDQAADVSGDVLGHELLVAQGPTYIVPHRGGTSLQVYAGDGSFIRSIGARGDGPGEFQSISSTAVLDSVIYVADWGRGRLVRVTTEGELIDEHPYPFAEGRMVAATPELIIAASDNRHPDRVGYPLHLFDVSTRSVLVSTGSEDGRYAPQSRFDIQYHISRASHRDTIVWFARSSEPRFERWHLPGLRREAVVEGELDWFPQATEPFNGTRDPPTTVKEFVVDSEERLWLLTWIANPEWRRHVTLNPDRGHSWEVGDVADLMNVRLDVYDLQSGTHTSGPIWDEIQGP